MPKALFLSFVTFWYAKTDFKCDCASNLVVSSFSVYLSTFDLTRLNVGVRGKGPFSRRSSTYSIPRFRYIKVRGVVYSLKGFGGGVVNASKSESSSASGIVSSIGLPYLSI